MKKILTLAFMLMVIVCLFAVSASATTIDKNTTVALDGSFTDANGNAISSVPLYDADGDALVWYLDTNGKLVSSKIASLVTVNEEGVISFTDKSIFLGSNTYNSVIVVNLRDNVKVSGTDINWDGKIKHFDSNKGNSNTNDVSVDSTGFQFGSYNVTGKIQYFYFPTTAQSTVKRMFQGTPVKVVDIEPGTPISKFGFLTFYGAKNLKTILIPNDIETFVSLDGQGMFSSCSSLESVIFEENSILRDLGHATFRNCSSLKELYLPNSVITVGAEFARESGLQVISFGASFSYFTARGNGDPDANGQHKWVFYATNLKKVYMPVTYLIFSDTYARAEGESDYDYSERLDQFDKVFSNSGNSTTFFITGTKEQVEALKTRIASTNDNEKLANSLNNIISYEEYIASGSPEGAMAVYGCNVCDTFYNGEHEFDKDCTTADACSHKCGLINTKNESHNDKETLTFANGLTADGVHSVACQNDGCTVKTEETVKPVFTAKGYSTNAYKNAINGGYEVNLTSLALYERLIGTLEYGIVIANASSFGEKTFLDENNKVNSDKALQVEMDKQYSSFDCSINFGTNTGIDLDLVITAYVIEGDTVTYIQSSTGNDVKIGDTTFKSVTLAQVIALVPAEIKEN